MMNKTIDVFGDWLTGTDGKAHYVLSGRCLCDAKVKKFTGPPARQIHQKTGAPGKYLTPLCLDCMDLNTIRWCDVGGNPAPTLRPQRQFWWNQRRR
jgi:hypothetical protein